MCDWLNKLYGLLNQASVAFARMPGFLKLLWFACWYVCVCVSVCVSAPEGINNQWCDIGRVGLVKQVSRLFPALITLYDTCHR